MSPNSNPPWNLTALDMMRARETIKESCPDLKGQETKIWASCRDHYLSTGEQRMDWAAVFRTWLKREQKIQNDRKARKRHYKEPDRGSNERPAEPRGNKQSNLEALSSILRKKEEP